MTVVPRVSLSRVWWTLLAHTDENCSCVQTETATTRTCAWHTVCVHVVLITPRTVWIILVHADVHYCRTDRTDHSLVASTWDILCNTQELAVYKLYESWPIVTHRKLAPEEQTKEQQWNKLHLKRFSMSIIDSYVNVYTVVLTSVFQTSIG